MKAKPLLHFKKHSLIYTKSKKFKHLLARILKSLSLKIRNQKERNQRRGKHLQIMGNYRNQDKYQQHKGKVLKRHRQSVQLKNKKTPN